MSAVYRPIMSTLGYVLSPDRANVLMLHRITRTEDEQYGKYNGLGGHLEPNEDVATGMIREIREEAGIEVVQMMLRGTVNWTGFGPKGEDWLAFIFRIEAFDGTPMRASREGKLSWIPLDRLSTLPMWEGDRYFLPLVFDADNRPFHGYMPYANDKPRSWTYVRM